MDEPLARTRDTAISNDDLYEMVVLPRLTGLDDHLGQSSRACTACGTDQGLPAAWGQDGG